MSHICAFSNPTSYFQLQMRAREHNRTKSTGHVRGSAADICPLTTPAAFSRSSPSPFPTALLLLHPPDKLPRSVKRLRSQHMPAAISPRPPSVGKRERKQLGSTETISRLREALASDTSSIGDAAPFERTGGASSWSKSVLAVATEEVEPEKAGSKAPPDHRLPRAAPSPFFRVGKQSVRALSSDPENLWQPKPLSFLK